MSDENKDKAFWDLVDKFVDLANDETDQQHAGTVNDAFLYAAARFSAHIVAVSSEDRKAFKEDKDEALNHVTDQFRTMLEDNLEDYQENFKIYTSSEE